MEGRYSQRKIVKTKGVGMVRTDKKNINFAKNFIQDI
jgi:hypothetical protein